MPTAVWLHGSMVVVWGILFLGACVSFIIAHMHHVEPTNYFLLAVPFVSLASLYANIVTHASALEGAKAKRAVDGSNSAA